MGPSGDTKGRASGRAQPKCSKALNCWDAGLFRASFSYAASFQLISLLVFVCDPLTKGFLSRYGSISMVGYYEMANKLVLQFRALLVGSSQVLVPVFVKLNRLDPARFAGLFDVSYQVFFFLAIVVFGFAIAAAPLISEIWIGRLEPVFVLPVILLSIGWCINSIGLPAYHAGMGTGELRPNIYSHVLMAGLNLVLALVLGYFFKGNGVVWGWSIALAAGGVCTTWLYLLAVKRSIVSLVPTNGLSLVTGVVIATVASGLVFESSVQTITHSLQAGTWVKDNMYLVAGAGAVLIYLLMMTLATMRHPVRRQLLKAIADLPIKKAITR